MKVTVIIINYNYARFLSQCIESAVSQDYSNKQVIVVDDGSLDSSASILADFAARGLVEAIYKENGGMVSAANLAFEAASGEIIMFVDADDCLLPGILSRVVKEWTPDTSMVYFRLEKIDKMGASLGTVPSKDYSLIDIDARALLQKFGSYPKVPTSGNAFSTKCLRAIFPIEDYHFGKDIGYSSMIPLDAYLWRKVPTLGRVGIIDSIGGVYRIHGDNNGATRSFLRDPKKRMRVVATAVTDQKFYSMIDRISEEFSFCFFKDVQFLATYSLVRSMSGGASPILALKVGEQNISFGKVIFSHLRSSHMKSGNLMFCLLVILASKLLPKRVLNSLFG